MIKRRLTALAAAVLSMGVFGGLTARADFSIAVPNFSFENPIRNAGNVSLGLSGDSNNAVSDWDLGGMFTMQGGVFNNSAAQFPSGVPNGSQFAYLGTRTTGDVATMTLTPAFNTLPTITAGVGYTLTVAVGHRLDNVYPAGTVSIDLLANGVSVATNTINANSITMGSFQDIAASLTAAQTATLGGQQLSIRISAANTSGTANTHNEGDFDNVRLTSTAAAPEPASLGLLGLGVSALLLKRRRA